MRYEDCLKDLLRPLGVYDLEGPVNGAALGAEGAALDEAARALAVLTRESDLTTAEDWGLTLWRSVLELSPAAGELRQLRHSLWALLRIRAGMATLGAIRDTLEGSGIRAEVEELATGKVRVSFPEVGGVPGAFAQLRANIEAILPAHVQTVYRFRYLTWGELEQRGWRFAEVAGMTWMQLACSV